MLLIIPIGGADMPTVISLLNSYAGLSAVAMGFVLENKLLIIAGALDGSSGLILSIIMCKAMNRSFTNVLFGAFGQVQAARGRRARRRRSRARRRRTSPTSSTNADRVVIIPGYGMAVAQAQHRVRELYDQLTKRGVDVKFAIHPVAGRMPGHMNVLLAEAEIPYDALVEMDDINPEMPQTDVCLVVGANDVVNPAARHDKGSPIFGMPIIDADKAKTVHRDQALDEPRLRRHRERALLRRQHADGVRRRQAGARRRRQGGLGRGRRTLVCSVDTMLSWLVWASVLSYCGFCVVAPARVLRFMEWRTGNKPRFGETWLRLSGLLFLGFLIVLLIVTKH